jgi:hypothetical protein
MFGIYVPVSGGLCTFRENGESMYPAHIMWAHISCYVWNLCSRFLGALYFSGKWRIHVHCTRHISCGRTHVSCYAWNLCSRFPGALYFFGKMANPCTGHILSKQDTCLVSVPVQRRRCLFLLLELTGKEDLVYHCKMYLPFFPGCFESDSLVFILERMC